MRSHIHDDARRSNAHLGVFHQHEAESLNQENSYGDRIQIALKQRAKLCTAAVEWGASGVGSWLRLLQFRQAS